VTTLVRLPNWVGDTVLALPALEGLAAMDGTLVMLGRAASLELTEHIAPQARRLLLRRDRGPGLSPWEAARALRLQRIDQALLMTPSFSSALCAWVAGSARRIGWAEQGRGILLTRRVPRSARGATHICEEFKALAREAGATAFPEHPIFPRDPRARRAADAFLDERVRAPAREVRPRLALCPGVQYGWAKQWPADRFHALRAMAEQRGWSGIVIGSAREEVQAARVLAGAGQAWVSACGAGTLRMAAELLRTCDAAVCNDTGTMHLAAAVGTPVVAIFGPSAPTWTGPRGRHRVLRANCTCAPCYRRTCPQGQPAPCMMAIEVPEVMRALTELVGARGAADAT
jgi:heptosyltransferase II